MVTQKKWQDVPSIPVTREQIQEARRIVDENFPRRRTDCEENAFSQRVRK